MTTSTLRVSYFLKVNRYKGTCAGCGEPVAESAGFVQKGDAGWETLCHACVRANGRTTPLLSGPAQIATASSVVRGGQTREVHVCNTCGHNVAWVKSSKSGKWYLAQVKGARTESGAGLRVYDFEPHQCEEAAR